MKDEPVVAIGVDEKGQCDRLVIYRHSLQRMAASPYPGLRALAAAVRAALAEIDSGKYDWGIPTAPGGAPDEHGAEPAAS